MLHKCYRILHRRRDQSMILCLILENCNGPPGLAFHLNTTMLKIHHWISMNCSCQHWSPHDPSNCFPLVTDACRFLIELLLKHKHNVLLTGPTGTGKTVSIKHVLSRFDKEKYTPAFINFSYQSTANTTQDFIDSKVLVCGNTDWYYRVNQAKEFRILSIPRQTNGRFLGWCEYASCRRLWNTTTHWIT